MVNVVIDNTPVSITLAYTETTTVPTGETWKVTITTNEAAEGNLNASILTSGAASNDWSTELVLVGGDKIKCTTGNGIHINGFKL